MKRIVSLRLTVMAMCQRVTARWAAFTPREQGLVGLFLVATIAVALFYGAVRPLQSIRAEASGELVAYETLNVRLSALGLGTRQQPSEQRTGPATAIAASIASGFGLTLDRNVAEGEGLRVAISEAPFDRLIEWIAEIERSSPLRVSRARFAPRPTSGLVSAEIVLTP